MVSAEREQPDRPSSFATHSFPPEENGHKYHLICPVPTTLESLKGVLKLKADKLNLLTSNFQN